MTLRVIVALTITAFLFADWAAASEYVNLSCCPQRVAQDQELLLEDADCPHHHEADVVAPDDAVESTSESCCETCDRCNGYINAHFVAVGFAPDCDRVDAILQSIFPIPAVHMADSSYPPVPPPPRSVSAHC